MDPKDIDETSSKIQSNRCALNKDTGGATCLDDENLDKALIDVGAKRVSPNASRKKKEKVLLTKTGCITSSDPAACPYMSFTDSRLRNLEKTDLKEKWTGRKTHWELDNYQIDTIQQQLKNYFWDQKKIRYAPLTTWYVDFMETGPGSGKEYKSPPISGKNKNERIGLVFNTANYPTGGIHWISIFIDPYESKSFEVFDSYGRKAQSQIKEWYNYLSDGKFAWGKGLAFKVYDIRQQEYSTDECGVYALYFLWRRLAGATFEELQEENMDNKRMRKFRRVFFDFDDPHRRGKKNKAITGSGDKTAPSSP